MMKKMVSLLIAVMLLSMCPAMAEDDMVLADGWYHANIESDSATFKVVGCL